MDANFQTDDKSPFSDPGMNGLYETNGNHLNNHMQNESDDDFGPETDVDAVDDVLTSPKNLNPFAKDCWQKTVEECSDKLIELPKNIGGEIMKFTEDFVEPAKSVEDNSNQIESNALKLDKFPVDSMNPFETPITNNPSVASNVLSDFVEDNNKYVEEINSKKEEGDSFTFSNVVNQSSDLKNNEDLLGKPHEKNAEHDLFSFDSNNFVDLTQTDSCATPKESNIFSNEDSPLKMEEGVEKLTLESPVQKKSASEFGSEFDMKGISSNENNGSESSEINTTLNKINESRELKFKTHEEAMDLIEQGVPLDASGYPPTFCSVTDTVEAEKVFCDFSSTEKSVASKGGDELSSELFSPSAPAFDGEIKDDTIAESGGEVEESEDDEWNYIKVESGVHQAITVDSKVSDTVLSAHELSELEKPTMNSPLNPEADEFIPISAMSTNHEFNTNMTPKKAVSDDLTDIIASSPNWNNMNNVSLPEESAFLNEIKSRPSNIFENIESPPQEDLDDKTNDLNSRLDFKSSEEKNKENELATLYQGEPHGIDSASDMTSSFIDPSTMSSEVDVITEKPDLMNSQIEEFVTKRKELFLKEGISEVQELADVEMPSKVSEVSSLAPEFEPEVESVPSSTNNEVMSFSVEAPKSSTKSGLLDVSQSPLIEVQKSKAVETSQVTTLCDNEQCIVKPPSLPKSSVEEKTNDTVSSNSPDMSAAVVATAAAAAIAAVVASAGVVDKKDVKKTTPKGTSSGISKTTATSKVLLNGMKASATARKPTSSAQNTKTSVTGKTAGATAAPVAKTMTPKINITSRAQPKTTTSVSSTINKAPARSRPTSAAVAASKSSPTKTAVTISPTKSSTTTTTTTSTTTVTTLKIANKTPVSSPVSLKAKPRVSSATVEKKSTPAVNGETKTTVKRLEVITKKTSGGTTSATAGTVTRVSLTGRPISAPTKSALKTTATTTRNVTAKPRTTLSSIISSTTLTNASKTMPTARKPTIGTDKQAKEVANRLTSKTASVPKSNGIVQRNTNTTMAKTRKTLTTTPTTLSKTKNHKTENKAEKILEEKVETIQNEKGAPLIENINNSNINLLDNMASE